MIKKFEFFLIKENIGNLLDKIDPKKYKTFYEYRNACINYAMSSYHDEDSGDELTDLQDLIKKRWNEKTC